MPSLAAWNPSLAIPGKPCTQPLDEWGWVERRFASKGREWIPHKPRQNPGICAGRFNWTLWPSRFLQIRSILLSAALASKRAHVVAFEQDTAAAEAISSCLGWMPRWSWTEQSALWIAKCCQKKTLVCRWDDFLCMFPFFIHCFSLFCFPHLLNSSLTRRFSKNSSSFYSLMLIFEILFADFHPPTLLPLCTDNTIQKSTLMAAVVCWFMLGLPCVLVKYH